MSLMSHEVGGLGGHRVFDPQNLNYQIRDHIPHNLSVAKTVIAVTRLGTIDNAVDADPDNKVKALDAVAATVGYKYHFDSAYWADQGDTPMCTAFCAVHFVADGPITNKANPFIAQPAFYAQIQEEDRKMGYYFAEGCTSLAMAKALKKAGRISGYLWGYTLDELVHASLVAPVMLGVDWFTGMDSPDKKHGVIRAIGSVRGGHEILVNGVDVKNGMFRLKNSWGRMWGKGGHCYLPFEDAEKLIAMGGDVCMATEVRASA